MTDYDLIEVFTVTETVNEFGAHGALIGIFADEEKAKHAAHKRGWYGSDASVERRWGIHTEEGVHLLDRESKGIAFPLGVDLIQERKEQIKRALAKLTPFEKGLLNLRDA